MEGTAGGSLLTRLQRATRETAFLGIQNGAAAQYVMRQSPDRPDRLLIESGLNRSLMSSDPGARSSMLEPDHQVLSLVRRSNADADIRRKRQPTSIRYGDSIACTSVERRKPWYDGGGGGQLWPLLEPPKSQ